METLLPAVISAIFFRRHAVTHFEVKDVAGPPSVSGEVEREAGEKTFLKLNHCYTGLHRYNRYFMSKSQQRWEESEGAHSLATSIITSENNVFICFEQFITS